MNNCMLDIETLGNHYDAKIVSIGAVMFDSKKLGDTFYRAIDPEKSHGTVDASTIKWWMKQSEEARKVFNDPAAISELLALMEFQVWLGLQSPKKSLKVWGNGPTFDNVIIKSAFERNRLQLPWDYWNDRCFRTYSAMFSKVKYVKTAAVKHNALDDAVSQATHMIKLSTASKGEV